MVSIFYQIACVASLALFATFSSPASAQSTPSGFGNLSSVLHCGGLVESGSFVQATGRNITFNGKPLALAGYTMYPIHANWHDKDFDRYTDQIVTMAQRAGQNLIRPTDEWG